jgi:exportin-1
VETENKYLEMFIGLFHGLMIQISILLPLPPDDESHIHYAMHIPKLYADGTEEDENFIANLGIFFATFFRMHLTQMENNPSTASQVITAHKYLIGISNVDHKEVFKTCLEYWLWLAEDVFKSWKGTQTFVWGPNPTSAHRKMAYSQIFSDCRKTMIRKMVKPEEVIIVEDENGEITKEYMPDVDAQQLYHSMRELLIFLTHLDFEDTETIMLDKLASQVDRSEWNWHNLNTLCWAVGSISGSMTEDDEKRFLVAVIKDLLGLCEMMRGKENKAVIASNIMYVVGQYPRFLKAHWKFLKTVVNKLFEFMHESFPGVQDMAVDTFLKICKQCKEKFVVLQIGETQTFVDELLADITRVISDLESSQKHAFYEAVGHMISKAVPHEREPLIHKLMILPNTWWQEIISTATLNVENLKDPALMKELANVIKTNVRVCRAVGHAYISQLSNLFIHLMTLYKLYSGLITNEVATHGGQATKYSYVRGMRIIKREILCLVQEFIESCEDPENVTKTFIPPLLEAILLDYKNSVPDARDAQVLSLMAVVVKKLQNKLVPEVGRILEATLDATLQMITKNFEDFPEHRINFFKLLKELNAHCFPTFLAAVQQSKVIMDSIVWAFKHTERNIGETGLTILYDFLNNVLQSDLATPFYQVYFLTILNETFVVLTDTLHKTGFKMQCQVMQHMVQVVSTGRITAPLSQQQPAGVDNVSFVQQYIITLLTNFPNLSRRQIEIFIKGMFELKDDLFTFKNHMRDFLVQLKEFSVQDNAELYDEEREAELARKKEAMLLRLQAVPGLDKPVPANPKEEQEMID